MKITVLCENSAGSRAAGICGSEWGFSAYIQAGKTEILFDSGYSGIFWSNAEALGINLQNIDYVVLSHRHWDHVDGLMHHGFKEKKKLVMHPLALESLPPGQAAVMKNDFEIIRTEKPLKLADDIFFLGQIPGKTGFETRIHKGVIMDDDSALAVVTGKGVVVITGCSHAGICNICEYAKEITGSRLYGAIGGFHLSAENTAAVEGTVEYFRNEKPGLLCPMHCVDFKVMARFYNEFGIEKYGSGDIIETGNC